MAASGENVTELGFLETVDWWRVLSHYFPSKIGGKPAWLSLANLPNVDELKCTKCGKPCIFLLQVYANLENKDDCFHRTILLFICKDPRCLASHATGSMHAFRSQLPRKNSFYSDIPPNANELPLEGSYPKADTFQKLCTVCGCSGSKVCGKCHSVTYCSKEHQVEDWKCLHKKLCGSGQLQDNSKKNRLLFPEFELVTEPEEFDEMAKSEKTEMEKNAEYEEFLKSHAGKEMMHHVSEKELSSMVKEETIEDEVFETFKNRIRHEPQQVLRYCRRGNPLLVSSEGKPESIPKCGCGASRQFEFQVMPQLLNHLQVDSVGDSIDWGTLIVYTCENSCDIGENYIKEFVWKQDFASSNCVSG